EVRNQLTFGNPDGLLVVYVGRLAPEKRLDKLLTMCRSVDNVYLALIGDGPVGAACAARHGQRKSPNPGRKRKGDVYCRPAFLAHDALPRIYASADVHVSCSTFETLGNTVPEAHACSTPVLVPRAQGFVDTVTDKVDGFLFDAGNLAEGARLLARLRDERDLCCSMGAKGREKVLQQSPELVMEDIVAWYKR
ncbi:unnamed protein product, partial [Choristocarpus tenellus]